MIQIDLIIPNKPVRETKVVVAMSGGVDSSTVAAYLHKMGYNVIGITLQLYNDGTQTKKRACCAGRDIYDSKRVASKFNFPHYVLNYESIFRQKVIDDFADSYLRGETPIPCVRCNQSVKFQDLLKVAHDLKADALATGHYVRRVVKENQSELHVALDSTKDQSYFLFATTKEQLQFLRFPLGDITKEQTREIARSLGVEIADKPDSQDICFVGDGSYAKLLEKLRPNSLKKGRIVHVDGRVLGQHNSIINYTIGQRKGLGIAFPNPLYVVNIDPDNNEVIVGPKEALFKKIVYVKDMNWITSNVKQDMIQGQVKLRSNQDVVNATIVPARNNKVTVFLKEQQFGISPGQACVIYNDSQVLGGGWISSSR